MDKWLNNLGLAKKAGKIVISIKLEESIKTKKVSLVIIASDAAKNSYKKWIDKCNFYKIEYLIKGTKKELAYAIGKEQVSAIGITDINLAKLISLKIKEGENDGKE